MPSFRHEFLVDLFRRCGELAPELLRIWAQIELDHDRIEQGSIDLSQVVSTEYRADSVVVLRDREGAAAAAVIVEVQLAIDRDKFRTWPVYVTALRAKHGCGVVLLVLAPDRTVASWARSPISIGHPGFCLEPLVLGFDDMPRIIDPRHAQRLPELAVLSTMAHPEIEVATVAIGAISQLPEDQSRLYLDVILAALPAEIRDTLEAYMQSHVYQSEFARKYYDQGREEGREEGLHSAVYTLARAKRVPLTADDEAAIAALRDGRGLTALIHALGDAHTTDEARAALEHALARAPSPE